MSGNNSARKVQRSLLHRGKITKAQYRAMRRRVDVDAMYDAINGRIERRAALLTREISWLPAGSDHRAHLEDVLRQMRSVEVTYHPTKGYRFKRGDAISEAKP